MRQTAAAAWLGGMAPDLDTLIRSDEDTLLSIEYHHFNPDELEARVRYVVIKRGRRD